MIRTVKSTASWKSGMRVDVQARDHKAIVDQPEEGGGKNAGPNPMEYLLFSLGGCLGAVAAIIADQEKINLEAFDVSLEGDYDPAVIFGKTEEGQAGFTEIRVRVNIEADMTAEEKQAFFERVDLRCPLSDNLINSTKLVFTVA